MNKKLMAVVLSVLLVGSFACKKKEQQPLPQTPGTPGMGALPPGYPQQGQGNQGITMPKGELQVVVPANVKGKWGAVKIVVEDKTTKKAQEFTVKLNSELQIPNSNLKVAVGEFLPHFKMDVGTITSISNEPNNPAVNVKVYEGGKEVFKGWLYGRPEFRNIHPFDHPKYGVTLKEGVKKG